MDLEEMKGAWQELNARLDRQQALHVEVLRDLRLTRMRHGLRPLFWRQVAQVAWGVPLIVLGAAHWNTYWQLPHQLISGVIVHVYGVLTVMLAGVMMSKMSRLDYAAPVTGIQEQLARLRWYYLRASLALGLAWWLLWIPVMMALLGLVGVDLYANAPGMIYGGLGVGVVGLLATRAFHRWSHHPSRAELGQRVDDAAVGGSLTKAREILDELARFERE